jgi:putative ABC transport system permease protein
MAPGQPFSYTFMNNDFNNMYNAEQCIGKLFITFAIFAIFIACLGLMTNVDMICYTETLDFRF